VYGNRFGPKALGEDGYESGLLEVTVGGECLSNAVLCHHNK
jgi:hypothetical protein